MLRDGDAFLMTTRSYTLGVDEVTVEAERPLHDEHTYVNDDFHDVFGSAPSSSTFPDNSQHDDDIWQSSRGNLEPSDVPRLKEKHETEGYRDGITNGKAESVQKGFDEGYGLGAVLGLRIGKILGLIEGIVLAVTAGLKAEGGKWESEKERLDKLFADAKEELGTQRVFGREYWGEDGIWKFEIPWEGAEGKEVLFPDVASAHPLVMKWDGIIAEEVQRWGLDLGIMDGVHEKREDIIEVPKRATAEGVKEVEEGGPATRMGVAKKELNW